MPRCFLRAVLTVCVVPVLATTGIRAEESLLSRSAAESFERSVRPVLAANCFACHGPEKQKAGLRLDSRAGMLTGGDSGPAIVPGHPEESLLVKAIHYTDEPRMPPKGKLSADAVAALTAWIKQGAPWPNTETEVRPVTPSREFQITAKDRAFWSFQSIANPLPPPVVAIAWPKEPLDEFILAKLEANGLTPAEPADKRTLIRRATFDLIGLPPTLAEVEAFLNDSSPDAFAKVVDRLLASPHFGERWARHWLDVARYGEDQAHTFQARKYPNGYRYRDWLIRAFNADLPYDRFIKEQIAADLLDEPALQDRLAALGFFALGPVYYGDPKKLDQLDDRIDTLTRGFLGLTVACARCHDHKFDPIPTKDYYGLAGIFASTEYAEVPLVPQAVVDEAKRKLTDADKKKNLPPSYPFVHALKDASTPVTMKVHIRGNPETLGDEAPRHFLSILSSAGTRFRKGSGRLELAEAIASANNPLTARVMVNRVWQHHFGKGLVATPSNFGAQGERPTHPELLDFLARRFIAAGWSLKTLHREIMLSATYQQSSRFEPHNYERDPDNKLLWRMNRRRLEVEAWRDAMLAVANHLNPTIGGPSLELTAPDNRRRTLYAVISRHELDSLLRLFDFPDPNITNAERTVTTVPLQQLFVLNSEFMVRNAKALAARLTQPSALAAGKTGGLAGEDDAARIRRAFLILYGRPASERELQLGLAFLAEDAAEAESDSGNGLNRWEQYAQVLLSASEFLYVD
ncbi:MAG TPA: PSD1 and planctomycete cytochrome C domain-containing protein [Gemmataceae bacterium]|nr:PSD1 and planctomycete cytochrome C domain-containing protein [Gemmataceae bacterium]